MAIIEKVKQLRSPYPSGLRWSDYVAVRAAAPLTPGRTRFLGRPVRYSDRTGFLHSVRELFADDTYMFKARTATPHIVDAGANIGLSVLYFKTLYPQATVVAFEPDADIFAMLEHNTAGLVGVDLRRAAAWVEDTTLTFYSEGSLAGSSEVDFCGKGNRTEVPAIRLLDELRKAPVDFLKIDIEGAENSVLFDIADELGNIEHLFFEYHSAPGKDQQLGDMLNLVRKAGFRYVINGAHGPRLPFVDRISRGFDLQLNVFCYRP